MKWGIKKERLCIECEKTYMEITSRIKEAAWRKYARDLTPTSPSLCAASNQRCRKQRQRLRYGTMADSTMHSPLRDERRAIEEGRFSCASAHL
jgi:hypothetical protein